ncbi:glycerol-3-phosphate 1-O-acyltransferase PlsY [Olsenella sp. Marseille-QA0557]|uniref:glycerol-3-phosphate 1-O-acyltransferase PlsY n=1 Tax=Olsenella sp. Marseille-QA0557 TaxID=3378782 RepID=UPI003D11F5ED
MTSLEALIYCIVAVLITFFICAIPSGYLISKQGSHVDVRKEGSGNIGTTNVARSVGKGAAALTLLCDAGKGFICVGLGKLIASQIFFGGALWPFVPSGPLSWITGMLLLSAVLGHIFTPYLGFHGGKGIAVGFGAMLAAAPLGALGLLLVFVVVVIPTRFVSAASVCAAISLPIWSVVIYHATFGFLIPALIACLVVIWAHRTNINKLLHGEERRFAFHHDDSESKTK